MTAAWATIALSLVLAGATFLGGLPANGCAADGVRSSSRDRAWVEDIEYLTTRLPALHKNLFFQVSREEFAAAAERLAADVPDLTDDGIKVGLARLVALAGDAHTKVLPFDGEGRTYPLITHWFSDGLYVIRAGTGLEKTVGCRVSRIADTDIDEAYTAVSTLISHENEQWVKYVSPAYLMVPEILGALDILPDPETASFTFAAPDGAEFEMTIAPTISDLWTDHLSPTAILPDPLLYQRSAEAINWLSYLPDSKTLYLQYNVCGGSDLAERLLPEAKVILDTRPVERFVIDLRNNFGGNSSILAPVIGEIEKRRSFNEEGRLFALISRKTFSSAVLNAIELKSRTKALLFGEPTGGKPNCYGEVRSLTLPNSQLKVSYSVKYFSLWPEDTPSLMPDVAVEVTAADYFAGRDPVMEAVLAYGH